MKKEVRGHILAITTQYGIKSDIKWLEKNSDMCLPISRGGLNQYSIRNATT